MIGENLAEVRKPEDLRPPKEWWEHCTRRLQEQGFSEERARRLCGWVFYHHLKPYPPEKGDKMKQERLRPGDYGRFRYRGFEVEWEVTPSGLVKWLAQSKDMIISDDRGGELGDTKAEVEANIKRFIDDALSGRPLPSGISVERGEKEKQETAEDILARIYSKISQGKELTEEEKKILAAYLEGVREESEEKGDKTKEIELAVEIVKMWKDDAENKCPICGKKLESMGEAVDHLIYEHRIKSPDRFRELLKQRELREILSRAMFNKPADELDEDELRRVHEVAVEIRRLMARQFGATEEIEEGEKESRLDEIKEEIKSMREKLKEIKKSTVKKLLKKIKKRKVKKKREEKPYTREARARKRAWLRARGRKV